MATLFKKWTCVVVLRFFVARCMRKAYLNRQPIFNNILFSQLVQPSIEHNTNSYNITGKHIRIHRGSRLVLFLENKIMCRVPRKCAVFLII
jgi:hypothetical protein